MFVQINIVSSLKCYQLNFHNFKDVQRFYSFLKWVEKKQVYNCIRKHEYIKKD